MHQRGAGRGGMTIDPGANGAAEPPSPPLGIVYASAAMEEVLRRVRAVAPTGLPVLITGETGTGKELIARAVHLLSGRARALAAGEGGRFVAVDCAACADGLLEDRLFGHVRGAFTGADRDREGLFEYAHRGTLLLDEVGDMPVRMQAAPLRALETGEVVRVGSNAPRRVDVRVVSATSRDLRAMVEAGAFRRDLYYRLRGAEVRVPPLRDRREDVPRLVRYAITRYCAETGVEPPGVTPAAMLRLTVYHWPGNVRQLLAVVREMLARMAASGAPRALDLTDLPEEISPLHGPDAPWSEAAPDGPGSLAGMTLAELERRAIRDTLRRTGGSRVRAAAMLGIGVTTLYRKLKAYGLT